MRRLSRPCYDKPHRCPGWAGGGMKHPKGESRCDNGSVRVNVVEPAYVEDGIEYEAHEGYPGAHQWRPGRCNTCNVTTIPFVLRHLDPTHWANARIVRRVRLWWRFRQQDKVA